MNRITAFFVFCTAFTVGLYFAPAPSVAYTPPLPPVESAPPRPLAREIVVFVDVPLDVAPDVVAGIRAWERATRGWRRWRLGPITEAHMMIIQVEPGAKCPLWAAACAGSVGGLERDENAWGRAWMVRGGYEAGAKVITMHEIGHSLGLWHVDGTMMAAQPTIADYLGEWRCPDSESLLRLQWRIGVALDASECADE